MEGINKYLNKKYIEDEEIEKTEQTIQLYNEEDNSNKRSLKSIKISGCKIKYNDTNINSTIYPIDHFINNNINFVNNEIIRIHLCIYKILNKNNTTPFLQYLLLKTDDDIECSSSMIFPYIEISLVDREICNIINIVTKSYENIVSNQNGKESYKGFHLFNNELYFFFEYNNNSYEENYYKCNEDKLWWVLIDEICNWKRVLSYSISDNVTYFFYNNNNLIYLYDEFFNKIEIPIVAYCSGENNMLEFIYLFGINYESTNFTYGRYYYFTTYNESIRIIQECMDLEGGMVRFAIFLGNSETLLLDKYYTENIDTIMNNMSNENKSIYLNNNEEDSAIKYVVNNYNQHVALSIHTIKKI